MCDLVLCCFSRSMYPSVMHKIQRKPTTKAHRLDQCHESKKIPATHMKSQKQTHQVSVHNPTAVHILQTLENMARKVGHELF